MCGCLNLGDELLLGPLDGGCFKRVVVSGIHRSKVDVQSAKQGQHATVAVQHLEDADTASPAVKPAAAARAASPGAGVQLSAAAQGDYPPPPSQQQQQPHPPRHTDSAGCLHAWMQQASGAAAGEGCASQAGQQQLRSGPFMAPSTPTLTIQGQLKGSRRQQQAATATAVGSAELQRHWSSPQLLPASSGPVPRPRKASATGTAWNEHPLMLLNCQRLSATVRELSQFKANSTLCPCLLPAGRGSAGPLNAAPGLHPV